MKSINKILVPIEFSKTSTHLLNTGIDLARRTGASLYIYHFAPTEDMSVNKLPSSTNSEILELVNRMDEKINKLLAFVRGFDLTGVEFHTGVKFSKLHIGLSKLIQENNIDLLMMQKSRKFNLIGFMRNNPSRIKLNELPCPCLMIDQMTKKLEVENILIPPYLTKSKNTQIVEEILQIYDPQVHLLDLAEQKNSSFPMLSWLKLLIQKLGFGNDLKYDAPASKCDLSNEIDLVVVRNNSIDQLKDTISNDFFGSNKNQHGVPVLAL